MRSRDGSSCVFVAVAAAAWLAAGAIASAQTSAGPRPGAGAAGPVGARADRAAPLTVLECAAARGLVQTVDVRLCSSGIRCVTRDADGRTHQVCINHR